MGRIWAVVPAGGSGRRFGGGLPKQYLLLHGRPVLAHALGCFLGHPRITGVQLVLPVADLAREDWRACLGDETGRLLPPVAGGAERADSVGLGLQTLLEQGAAATDWVLVHDAARPCLRREDLDLLLGSLADAPQGALLALPVADTLKREDHGRVLETVERSALWRAFTPQAFPLGALAAALADAAQQGWKVTDEASAMERQGWRPLLVPGHGDNIKVTLPEDLPLAAAILEAQWKEQAK
ncbi:MAG: 2-C-methyl-D-erythritol 4-phosphate cytidylyltransferase [Gammaproteobacteria bacterium]|nr:2-C-methyl-D-erythritol 4-phosphate cytidylyltransferase [Gammaproteobacteria bacterium]